MALWQIFRAIRATSIGQNQPIMPIKTEPQPMPNKKTQVKSMANKKTTVDCGTDVPQLDTLHDVNQLATRAITRVQQLVGEFGEDSITKNANIFPIENDNPLSGEKLDLWIERAHNNTALMMVGRGIAYLIKRQELPSNAFSGWLRDTGIDKSDAYKCIKVATMYANLSEEAAAHVPKVDFQRQAALARLPSELVEQLATDGTLDGMGDLSRKQFVDELKSYQKIEKKLEIAEKQLTTADDFRKTVSAPITESEYPEPVADARVTGASMGMLACDAISRLMQLNQVLVEGKGLSHDKRKQLEELRAGVSPLFVSARSIQAQLSQLLIELDAWTENYKPDTDSPPELLTAEEARAAIERAALMTRSGRAKG